MIFTNLESRRRRRAITGVLATIIMFTMLFSVGLGFFLFVNQSTLTTNQANSSRQAQMQQASLERLALSVKLSTVSDPWSQTGDLWLRVNNTGGATATILDVYVTAVSVTGVANGQVVSRSQVSAGSYYLNKEGTLPQMGDLNVTLPLSVSMGTSTKTMVGCAAAKAGCDIAISKTSYLYVPGTTVLVSVLTSAGNVFSVQYPLPPTSTSTTTTISTVVYTTTTISSGGVGGNALVVRMVATPPQTLTCNGCVTDTVTIYNYATSPATAVALSPSPPAGLTTGTASLSGASCTGPFRYNGQPMANDSISAWSGSGNAHYVYYTCTYSAQTGAVGGFASFLGGATGTINGNSLSSAQEVSNTIQVGGTVSVLNQGPFSANYFFFKDSYCYQATTTTTWWSSPCSPTPSSVGSPNSLTLASLPNANAQNASTDYYDAYYVQITNDYNTSLPLLQYSYFQTDPTNAGESDFYLVGVNNTAYRTNGAYYPAYPASGTPSLTAYPTDCTTVNSNNVPTDPNCIYVKPGHTVTLTFAACGIGASNWDWGGSQYGRQFDNPTACFPQSPPNYNTPESTYLSIIISFMYNGKVLDQQIPFQGETIFGGKTNQGVFCTAGKFCGTVYYTQYTGSVDYFDFTYTAATHVLSIPAPVVIASGLPHGADGLGFNPQDHMLLVGTNDGQNYFNEVNPTTGAVTTYPTTVNPYNVHVDSSGTKVWMDGDGIVGLASVPLSPSIGSATTLPLTGDDSYVNALMFLPGDSTHAYYTSDTGPRFAGQYGHVGIINLQTGVTTCFKTSGSCTQYNGVHGGVYDPYTGDLIVFGADEINQITLTGSLVANEVVSALSSSTFDQGALDGYGHLFIAWNGGSLYFEDYAASGVIGSGSNFSYITPQGGIYANFANLDDLAPIVGPGSQG